MLEFKFHHASLCHIQTQKLHHEIYLEEAGLVFEKQEELGVLRYYWDWSRRKAYRRTSSFDRNGGGCCCITKIRITTI